MRSLTILIADSEEGTLDMLVKSSMKAGLEATGTVDGAEAMGLLAGRPFDFAVVDLSLEPLGGLTVLRFIRAFSPGTRAAVLAARPTLESAITLINEGLAFRYLRKHVDDLSMLPASLRDLWGQQTPVQPGSQQALRQTLRALGIQQLGVGQPSLNLAPTSLPRFDR